MVSLSLKNFSRRKSTLNANEFHIPLLAFPFLPSFPLPPLPYLPISLYWGMASNRHVLRRPRHGRTIGGVLAGIAKFYGIGVTPLRLLVFVLALFFGTGILAYLIAWAIIPSE